ncbi:DegT/DnrJ/EryC1/StrS family aminotransferase [Nitrospira sp. MA-1]|nr:DegT/DnrJ/EryC1/StrS family aminotransferase [Nitrospira sp. MA-1]
MNKQGIGTSVHFILLHLHPYYRDNYRYLPKDFSVASSVFERIISLPIYPKMPEGHIQYVIEVVATLIKSHWR